MIKIHIRRTVPEDKQEELNLLVNQLRSITMGTPGYIAGETDLLVTWLYKLTIDQADYNIGSVVGILTFIITATATLLTYRRSKSYKEEDAFQ